MSLLENNPAHREPLERFEQTLAKLLKSHADYQKQLIQLTEENKRLKALLEASKTNLSKSTAASHQTFDNALLHQINKYIKDIDLCLSYFEQA